MVTENPGNQADSIPGREVAGIIIGICTVMIPAFNFVEGYAGYLGANPLLAMAAIAGSGSVVSALLMAPKQWRAHSIVPAATFGVAFASCLVIYSRVFGTHHIGKSAVVLSAIAAFLPAGIIGAVALKLFPSSKVGEEVPK